MRTAFRLFLVVLFLAVATPVAIAVNFWMEGEAVIARAEHAGALRQPAGDPHFSALERTIAIDQFSETWGTRALPCRTLALLWSDFSAPDPITLGVPVSQRLSTSFLADRRAASVRWQIKRLVVACQLEWRFTDAQLFRAWLASANFGQNIIGAESAAQAIFGKAARDLNAEESARLAALLRAPGLRNQPERWAERAQAISERVAPRPR